MTLLVSLDKLVDGLDEQSMGQVVFLDRETGEIVMVSQEALDAIGDEDEDELATLMDWEQEEREAARKVLDEKRYLAFPDPSEIHEWQIMADFSEQITMPQIQEALRKAVHGKGAYRRFKDEIGYFNLWDSWNEFRSQAFAGIMRVWCKENNVELSPE